MTETPEIWYEFPIGLDREPRPAEGDGIVGDLEDVRENRPDMIAREQSGIDKYPCVFCNPPHLVTERGVVRPDYQLVRADTGDVVAHACSACLVGVEQK
jgi:hypothetical protein